ncbi:MAG TPA: rhamnan synthesis F family protein [Polyangiaceae bacterium]|jgi:rhamnosyltransferase|nr:rhamnan synthesis F family protein [Polyangiaceae bacterium]
MKRVAFFAHFDAQDRIKPPVQALLRGLKPGCARIVFISTSKLSDAELAKLDSLVDQTLLKDNVGLDFGMWQHALARCDLADADELVLVNSSVVGPVFPLQPILDKMSADPCDFWGMTDNTEIAWHLQSYFLVFKRRVLDAKEFAEFWRSIVAEQPKNQIIQKYEVGLTRYLKDRGFNPAAFAATANMRSALQRWWMRLTSRANTTLFSPLELLNAGMPFVKVALLKDKSRRELALATVEAARSAGHAIDLLEL